MALYDNNPNAVIPKIRGDNPPLSRYAAIEANKSKRRDFNSIAVLSGAILLIGILASMALESFGGVIMCILTGVGAYYAYFKDADTELKKEAEEVNRQVFLDAYTIEVTCPLADRSTLRVSLHFQVPRNLNVVPHSSAYGAQPQDSHFVEQLNRVSEAKLVRYTQRFTEPPSYAEIEEYLRRELVQFQDENNADVLRIDVPLAIHVHPEKPKGVNV